MAYDPVNMLKDTVKRVAEAADDLGRGEIVWSRASDAANTLEQLEELAAGLAGLLAQTDALVRLAPGRGAEEASGLVREAVAAAALLQERVGRAREAVGAVRFG
ncbi:hypothetical protein ACIQBJ_25060 [Kitasatospora sp. NPDC088391]|uniref:hypothetical protein n=1 Tax=Kitasatospora sp. NPDC088391 TaxID=3364074 RepID=UPI00381660BD